MKINFVNLLICVSMVLVSSYAHDAGALSQFSTGFICFFTGFFFSPFQLDKA
jgi:hypothetical protein